MKSYKELQMYKLYVYQNQINGKVYFGQTNATLEKRAGLNGIKYKNCNRFYNAIQKYGWNNFTSYIIALCKTVEEANELEENTIAKARETFGEENVYNLKSGGLNHFLSDETKLRMSEAKTGKPRSEETKLKISLAKTGKPRSEETKLKMSLAQTGKPKSEETKLKMRKPRSDEHKRKISLARTGKKHSEETKQKISEANTGRTLSDETKLKMRKPRSDEHKRKISLARTGKKHSEETKQKLSEANTGKNHSRK